MLNNIVDTLNNVGSTTVLKAVFISPEQVVRFYACNREPQSIYGLFGGASIRKLQKLEQENTKDASLSLRKSLKDCLHYSFHVS